MRHTIYLLAVITSLSVLLGCKGNPELPATWAGDSVTVDGKMSDWNGFKSVIIDSATVAGIANDRENLYLMLRTRRPDMAFKIARGGLTLWVDPDGGGDREFMVRYRGGRMARPDSVMQRPDDPTFNAGGMPPLPDDSLTRPELFCYVKDRIVEKEIPADGSEGPAAANGHDIGDWFVWELRIPLDSGGVRNYGLGVEPGAKLGLQVVLGTDERQPFQGRPGGDFGEFGGGPPGGGMPGGGPAGGRPDRGDVMQRMQQMRQQEFKFTTTLATP